MKLRFSVIAVAVVAALTVTGLAAVGGDGNAAEEGPSTTTQHERFVGLTLDDASALAETEGRLWRVAREDETYFALTGDLSPGRVTFEVDDGIVTNAQIERAAIDNPRTSDDIVEDPARADLIAAAVLRLVTVDSSFGGVDVFGDFRVARIVGSNGSPLAPLDLELIAASLEDQGTVQFIDDPQAEIAALVEDPPAGVAVSVAVITVERIELLDDRAEIELHLWCGSLCGVYLTYDATPTADGWEITGTTGPIAVS
jgi:hypothetical protein